MTKNNIPNVYKVEGNIIYPDKKIITWGPFYYYSSENAKNKMEIILNDIVSWCNLFDPSLEIKAENIKRVSDGKQLTFNIDAWKDEYTIQNCDGIITMEKIKFEDL